MFNKDIAIMDLDSIMFSIGNPNKVLDKFGIPIKKDNKFVYEEKTHEELVDSSEFIMNKILTNSECKSYIAYIKGKNTTNAKRLINPNYKMDRHGEAPKWWNFVKGYLIENWGAIEANNLEVDDFVNITRLAIPESFICAIDSDLLGLEGTHYNWRKNDLKGEWITVDKKQASYKFWEDMICGTHNNTKGIPKIGKVGANKLLNDGYFWDITADKWYREQTFNAYINHFGEESGIEEFYKNYKMIKIADKLEGFELPIPIVYKNK